MNPDVSCICLTHGRPWLLAEAVESFCRQRLNGIRAELVIANDCPEQWLLCDVPNVMIINMRHQVMDLCQKTNITMEYCRGRYGCLWDDDDISLPDRITDGVARMNGTLAYRPLLCWSWNDGEIRHVGQPLFCSAMFDLTFVKARGGCVAGGWNDRSLWDRLYPTGRVVQYAPKPEEMQYIYRWGGIGWHESGSGEQNSEKRAKSFHSAALLDPRFKRGQVNLVPVWTHEYETDVKQAIRQGKGQIVK